MSWWPANDQLHAPPTSMTSDAVFFTIWECLGSEASFGFKMTNGQTASLHLCTAYHFCLCGGDGGFVEIAKFDVSGETEAQQRLMSLIQNPDVHTISMKLENSDSSRETTRLSNGAWSLFKNDD